MKLFALKEEDRNKLVSVLAEMQAKYSYNAIQLLHTLRELPQDKPQQAQPPQPQPVNPEHIREL